MIEELKALAGKIGPLPLCESWMYEAIRHCQRNMDLDVSDGFHEPERQSGEAIAKLVNNLPTILSALSAVPVMKEALEKIIVECDHDCLNNAHDIARQALAALERK